MEISAVDASNYLRGLMLLIRRDRKVTQSEVDLIMRIGKALGFEEEFCRQSVEGILENEYIREQPPRFSRQELARMFIRDGLLLAYSDQELHPLEEEWLRLIAELNNLDLQWFFREQQKARVDAGSGARLAVESLRSAELRP